MQIKRSVNATDTGPGAWQEQHGAHWQDCDLNAHDRAWLAALDGPLAAEAHAGLPFQPRSFRDCSLYERHWIDSSRGYVRRFLPWAYWLSQAFEAVARRPFPPFRPGGLWREQPVYYFANHLTIVPSGVPVAPPRYTRALDFELELAWVLAKPLLNATPQQAEAAIGGFVVLNDFSARDVQRPEMQTGLGPQKSKHFLTSISATLATADEILPRVQALQARVEINGQCVSETSTQGIRFSPGEVLAHLSRDEQLYPGELIATGCLPGGSGMELGRWLQAGDRLRLVIEGVGEITHLIVTPPGC